MTENTIAIFIDGANLYATARAVDLDLDYKRLIKEFQKRGTLLRAYYYTVVIQDDDAPAIHNLLKWLDYNGYTVVTKSVKAVTDAVGSRKVKGNIDVEITVDAMNLAERVDEIVLFSGNRDLCALVEAIQRRGVKVTVVSTTNHPAIIADELRRQADVFIDLVDLKNELCRNPVERVSRKVLPDSSNALRIVN